MITFSNDRHETAYVSDASEGQVVSRAFVQMVREALCDCLEPCGGNGAVLGGEASFEPADADGLAFRIVAAPGRDRR